MEDLSLELSRQIQSGKIPAKWQERFRIKRINEEDIEISLPERNAILQSLNKGDRFIQIGKYTLMLNSIKSINPKWGANNIPPRPKEEYDYESRGTNDPIHMTLKNKEELEEWDRLFKEAFDAQWG